MTMIGIIPIALYSLGFFSDSISHICFLPNSFSCYDFFTRCSLCRYSYRNNSFDRVRDTPYIFISDLEYLSLPRTEVYNVIDASNITLKNNKPQKSRFQKLKISVFNIFINFQITLFDTHSNIVL